MPLLSPLALPCSIELPYPPSANHLYATVCGRRMLSQKGREYRKTVVDLCFLAWTEGLLARPVPAPVEIAYTLFPPDRRRRDIENVLKIVNDSLQKAGVLVNDSEIDILHVYRKSPAPPHGRLHLTLQTIQESIYGI